jgi:hypothetical protein
MLVQNTHDGKIHAASYMSITTNENQTFYSIVPRYTHSIVRKGVKACGDCHHNNAVQEYRKKGIITVLGNDNNKPVYGQGILPVPQDWRTALQFAFWTREDGKWKFLKSAADQARIIFAMPLSDRQMKALAHPVRY